MEDFLKKISPYFILHGLSALKYGYGLELKEQNKIGLIARSLISERNLYDILEQCHITYEFVEIAQYYQTMQCHLNGQKLILQIDYISNYLSDDDYTIVNDICVLQIKHLITERIITLLRKNSIEELELVVYLLNTYKNIITTDQIHMLMSYLRFNPDMYTKNLFDIVSTIRNLL